MAQLNISDKKPSSTAYIGLATTPNHRTLNLLQTEKPSAEHLKCMYVYVIFINGGHAKKQWDRVHASEAYEALFSFVFLPHKPRLHALSPTVLRLSVIYEYGVCSAQNWETDLYSSRK